MERSSLRKQEANRARMKRKKKLNQHTTLNIWLILVSVCIILLLIKMSLS